MIHRERAVSGYPLEAELQAKQREVARLTEIAKKQEERIEELERIMDALSGKRPFLVGVE